MSYGTICFVGMFRVQFLPGVSILSTDYRLLKYKTDKVSNISEKNICRYMKGIRKEIIMEICYDGALVMPKNYAVVNKERWSMLMVEK